MNKQSALIDEKTPLMRLAGPMFGEMLLSILINNVDTLMLSHYSENAVGAVGNSNQVMFFIILMFNIIATSTSVVVAQFLGAKRYERMNSIYTLAFLVNMVLGIVLSALFVLLKGAVLSVIHIPAEMVPDAKTYITLVGGTLFLQAGYNVMLQILRCNGLAKIGMYVSLIVNVINIVGNYLFLYGFLSFLDFGVAGVALSTVIARIVALIISIVYFYHKKIGHISVRYIIPFPTKILWKMIKIGLPSAGENMSYNMYQIVLLSFINSMGGDAVNAKVYCQLLSQLVMVFSNTSAAATQIIVGHLVGAGKENDAYRRVYKTLRLTMPITITLAAVNLILCPYTLRFFTQNEGIIKVGFYILLVDVFIEIGRCLNVTFVGSLKAAGDYIYPFIIGLITMWGLGVTVGYGMGVIAGLGVYGVFIGTACDECIRGIFTWRRWAVRKWTGKSLVSSSKKVNIDDF